MNKTKMKRTEMTGIEIAMNEFKAGFIAGMIAAVMTAYASLWGWSWWALSLLWILLYVIGCTIARRVLGDG